MKKITRKELNEAMVFFREYLFVKRPRLINKIFIQIKTKKNLNADGWCYVQDEPKGREFLVILKSGMSYQRTMLTLAHEMVHAWQYAIGKFKVYDNGTYRYSGIRYSFDLDYMKRPWEKEAFELERVLYKAWCARKRKNKCL